ncbi:hypothetical protein LRAMOSA07928 [Lichtheimia ramosa]|uniref:Enoyl-CoA hydratase n=1 Tax=Lichtheimia ramosa TaxID=688394 RepID=A0A077WD97_9FUNG|nr:hypothetical protein LRAMOSA07928 [Lichtheimia ramosa]
MTNPIAIAEQELKGRGIGSVHLDVNYAPGVALMVIDNPQRHNAFSGKMMVEFRQHVLWLESQAPQDLVAVIVTGSRGKAFCAGLDLEFAREHMHSTPTLALQVNQVMHDALSRFARLPFITVASMAGHALGGGTELLTAFDYVCMASTAIIRFVQTRMGVSSPWGGARRLVNSVGRKTALRILASAPKITAEQGKAFGLVDVIVDNKQDIYEECLKASLLFLQPFVFDDRAGQDDRVSPGAIRGMKQLVVRADLDRDYEFEAAILAKLAGSSKI